MKGAKDKKFTLGWSLMDCTGCGSCAEVCPARNKAITMAPAEDHFMHAAQAKYDHLYKNVDEKETPFKESTVKGAQLKTPLMEFSGACPGCGETPYAKRFRSGDTVYRKQRGQRSCMGKLPVRG